jgi:hypothetical protein
MLLQALGSNAEFVRVIGVTRKIKRIAKPNLKRQSGLIVNQSDAACFVEFGIYPDKLISHPHLAIKVLPRGGNLDIPANYTGAIWVRWLVAKPHGCIRIHHYYYQKP